MSVVPNNILQIYTVHYHYKDPSIVCSYSNDLIHICLAACYLGLQSRTCRVGVSNRCGFPPRVASSRVVFVLFCFVYPLVLVDDFYNLGNNSPKEPIQLQGSQQGVHDQKGVQKPGLARPVVFDDALFADGQNVTPQSETDLPPPNDPIIKEGKDKGGLTKGNHHFPGRSLFGRKVNVVVAEDQKDGTDFLYQSEEKTCDFFIKKNKRMSSTGAICQTRTLLGHDNN